MDTGDDERKLIYAYVMDRARLAKALTLQSREVDESRADVLLDVGFAVAQDAERLRQQLVRTRGQRGGRGRTSRS